MLARSAVPALLAAVALMLPSGAQARKYDQRIHQRQHDYDVARAHIKHRHGHARTRAKRVALAALRGKRYWQRRQARHYRPRYVLPIRVVMCESGGDWRAVNRTPAGRANGLPGGAYQIIRPTWRAYGGLRFAPSAELATPWEQGVIALRVLRAQGRAAWECWT